MLRLRLACNSRGSTPGLGFQCHLVPVLEESRFCRPVDLEHFQTQVGQDSLDIPQSSCCVLIFFPLRLVTISPDYTPP